MAIAAPRIAAPRIRRSISRPQQSHLDLRMELFFHIPTLPELQRLRVHRSLSLIALQAMLQREFEVSFEDQRLYFHGDLLEGDEELAFYELHDRCVIDVRIRKRYRSIGDIFTKIKVVRFPSKAMHPEDFELVEVVAALPPLRIVFRRLGIAIAYITMLDRMQSKKSGHRVWRQHVNFWDEPAAPLDTTPFTKDGNPKDKQNAASTLTVLLAVSAQLPATSTPPVKQQTAGDSEAGASFVLRKCSPERVSLLMSMAHAHAIQERLQIPPESRTGADVRHIRKWLCSVKFFASANIPDPAFHEIAKNCVYERYRSGDYIFRQGDVGDFFYILISGCISLAAYGNGFFATMTPGMCFGEISLFEAKGVRTASANVNFAAPFAELAVLSGDVYRRVINPHKQAVLVKTEKAVYSIPQLRCLPDNILTHIAYASKTLTAKTGKRLIRCGDEMNVLVLLVAGEVKISTPRQKQQGGGVGGTSGRFKPSFNQESGSGSIENPYPIVSVVHAPAVFGQEGCLTNTPKTAPWDIDALDTCTLVCLRMDTISIFLAPNQDIIRALVAEHHARIKDFRRRFEQYALLQETRRSSSTVSFNKQASYLRLLSSRKLLSDSSSVEEGGVKSGQRRTTAARIEFPKVLMKDEPGIAVSAPTAPATETPSLHDIRSPRAPSTVSTQAAAASPRRAPSKTSFRNFFFGSRKATKANEQESEQQLQRTQIGPSASPTCAELQDHVLHLALPHGNMLDLREQIQVVSFEQQQRDWDLQQQRRQQLKQRARRPPEAESAEEEERVEAKTQALLHGLRKLQAEDVKMVAPMSSTFAHPQFHFAPSSSAVNT
ncbi:hypothetical protein Gpo141_00008781 [Globisporangium polare]